MKTRRIKVRLNKDNSYNIIIGINILHNLVSYLETLRLSKNAFIITNPIIKNLYAHKLAGILKKAGYKIEICCVPDTEKSKSIKTAVSVFNKLALFDKGTAPFLIAFGGGVVGDLTGFLASIYKRGTPYIIIPTTLLAQVDSSIGGKTAVDLKFGKNLIGTFYQPHLVFSDVSLLKTLSTTEILSGLSEVIKYAILNNKNLFSYVESYYKKIIAKRLTNLGHIVYICAFIKAKIIQRDEREEKGIRTLLNLGHTIGHAIEAAGKYSLYNHGQAISLGILCASAISNRLNILSHKELLRIHRLIFEVGLPSRISGLDAKTILTAISFDKKIAKGKLRFVLPIKIGKARIATNISKDIIRWTVRKYMEN